MSTQAQANPAALIFALVRKVPIPVAMNRITEMPHQQGHYCWQPCRAGYVISSFNQHADCKLLSSIGQSPKRQPRTFGRMIGLATEGGSGITIYLRGPSLKWAQTHATEPYRWCRRIFRIRKCKHSGQELAQGHITLEHMKQILKCLYGRKISISQRDLNLFALYLEGKEPSISREDEFLEALAGTS